MKKLSAKLPPHFYSFWSKIFVLVFGVVTCAFLFFDQNVSHYFAEADDNSFVYGITSSITDFGDAKNYLVILLGLWLFFVVILPRIPILKKVREKTILWKNLVIQIMFGLLLAEIPDHLLKIIIGRQRPHFSPVYDPYVFRPMTLNAHFHSFPSGHSEFIFCLVTILSFKWRRVDLYLFLFALTVSLSRIMLLQHFLSDIIMGALIGSFCASASYSLFRERWPIHP